MFFQKQNPEPGITLSCFSPPVVLATFTLELILALYVWLRYRSTTFGRLIAVFLAVLSVFQLAELAVCLGGPSVVWTRIGYVAITFLPVIGIDVAARLSAQKIPAFIGYAIAAGFAAVIGFFPGLFEAAQCTGNYVLFRSKVPGFDILFCVYYLATLFVGIGLAMDALTQKAAEREALRWLLIGYATFIVPTFVLYAASIVTSESFPSVFCGFAVILALIVSFKILPIAHTKEK